MSDFPHGEHVTACFRTIQYTSPMLSFSSACISAAPAISVVGYTTRDTGGQAVERPRAGTASMPVEKCSLCIGGTLSTVPCNPGATWCDPTRKGHAHKQCRSCGQFAVPEDVKAVYQDAGLEVPARI